MTVVLLGVALTAVTAVIAGGSGGGARIPGVSVGLGGRWGHGYI